MANKYVGAAQFVGEKIIKPIVKSFTKKQKTTGTEVIKSVKPGTNLTRKRNVQEEQIKGRDNIIEGLSDQSKINVKTKNPLYKFKQKISKIVDEKAKGGRVGLKAGTNPFKRKTNIDKIKETFAPKKRINAKGGFPDLSGDGKTTFKDILIGRGVIKKKNGKNKKKVI